MDTRYPGAEWRPLSAAQGEPSIGVPRVLIVHTMVGYLRSTEAMFRRQGFEGTESHFGLGGPWDVASDGASLDGVIWQWQSLDRQADAQAAGNAYATSVETSDGGDPDRPWSPAQVEALVDLGAWWCRTTDNPPQPVPNIGGEGIGYHRQFDAWNPAKHSCPGDVRLRQLLNEVIPGVAAAVLGKPADDAPVAVARIIFNRPASPMVGADVDAVCAALGLVRPGTRGCTFGPRSAAAAARFQRSAGLEADGKVGPATVAALARAGKAVRWAGRA